MKTFTHKTLLAASMAVLSMVSWLPSASARCFGLTESKSPACTCTTCIPKNSCIGSYRNDMITCERPAGCVISGGGRNDTITGSGGPDAICAGSGNDTVVARGGNDTVQGEDGDDTLAGHQGHDMLFGDSGNDELYGGDGTDYLNAGTGSDYVDGGPGNDRCLYTRGIDKTRNCP